MAPLSVVTRIYWNISSEMHDAIRRGEHTPEAARLDAEELEDLSRSSDPTGHSRDVTGRLRETCRREARVAAGLEARERRAGVVVPLRAAGARP